MSGITICLIFLVCHGPGENSAEPASSLKPVPISTHSDEYSEFLKENASDPVEYVVGKFDQHDIVFLGEVHQVKENCELVVELIEPLNKKGIKRLCSEFTPKRLNDELRAIVTAEEYDEAAVTELFRQGPWPTWGFKEYMDIVKEVWTVNQNRKADEPPFLIVGIDSDWTQLGLLEMNGEERFASLMEREELMIDTISKTAIVDEEKVLVHIGMAHTVNHGLRTGKVLRDKVGDRLFQVVLHHEFNTRQGLSPITETIENAFAASGHESAAFDVGESPFALLEDNNIPYAKVFEDIAQGYVILKPASQLQTATWVDGFISESNFEDALAIAKQFRIIKDEDPKTPAELDEACARFYKELKK